VNFWEVNTPPEKWREPVRLSTELTEGFYERFRLLIRLVKADSRFHITTYEQLSNTLSVRRVIEHRWMPSVKAQLSERFFPLTLPDSYCISDIFHACREMLCGKDVHECGTVYGFLEEPYAITEPVSVTKAEMTASVAAIPSDGWLPREIIVGGKRLGTADWLRAAMEIICGAESVTVEPSVWQIDLDEFPVLRDKHCPHCYGAKDHFDNHGSRRDRLQTWTLHLPAGTNRFVF